MRAIAVYLVVAFHAGAGRMAGGFVGVDVFFVLSGYLVTQLLLRDLDGMGGIRFARFYSRRVRRLLPAAFVVLVTSAVVWSAIATPVEVAQAEGGFRAAFLYVTNWYFIAQSRDYFAASVTSDPVLHFWSLAVEEQFYLLWPLLLGGLFVLGRRFGTRQRQVVRAGVAIALLASVAWAWSLKSSDPAHAYYGTDARAYQLMAGALLALLPTAIRSAAQLPRLCRWAAPALLATLLVVASSIADGLDPIERGVVVTGVTVGLLVALEASAGGWVQSGLSKPAVVYLGQVSYGTYLWHWPVIWVLARSFDLSTGSRVAWTALVATALASLSFQLMEHPIRRSGWLDRFRVPVIVTGLAVSVVSFAIIIPNITERAISTTASASGAPDVNDAGLRPVPAGLDFAELAKLLPNANCFGAAPTTCTLESGAGPHVLLMGDSHASMLIPTFRALARANDWTLSVVVRGGCPWQQGLDVTQVVEDKAKSTARCKAVRDDAYSRVIPALDPDVIVVANYPYETPGRDVGYLGPDGKPLQRDSAAVDPWIRERTQASLAALEEHGAEVVIIEPIPNAYSSDSLACLSAAKVQEECRGVASATPSPLEAFYRRLDRKDPKMVSMDLDTVVCPFLPVCDPIVGGHVVRADGNHLTQDFAEFIAPTVERYLTDNGVVSK